MLIDISKIIAGKIKMTSYPNHEKFYYLRSMKITSDCSYIHFKYFQFFRIILYFRKEFVLSIVNILNELWDEKEAQRIFSNMKI